MGGGVFGRIDKGAPASYLTLMNTLELKALLAREKDLMLLDVLPPESFEQEHLPGARNACVYQTDFLEECRKLIADPARLVVVYDSSGENLASSVAAEKLAGAGFAKVRNFQGGLEEWRAMGEPVEGAGKKDSASSAALTRVLRIDPEGSLVEWTGRNLASKHHGTIRITKGEIRVEDGRAKSGEAVLDMTSIASTDIEDADMARMLADHLKSDDFFDAAKYPEAHFMLREIAPIPGGTPGANTHSVRGALTMKGIEHPVAFEAAMGETAEGDFAAQAGFDLDRTKWNVLYGSGKFFERLGKHLVNDAISIQLRIVAR